MQNYAQIAQTLIKQTDCALKDMKTKLETEIKQKDRDLKDMKTKFETEMKQKDRKIEALTQEKNGHLLKSQFWDQMLYSIQNNVMPVDTSAMPSVSTAEIPNRVNDTN